MKEVKNLGVEGALKTFTGDNMVSGDEVSGRRSDRDELSGEEVSGRRAVRSRDNIQGDPRPWTPLWGSPCKCWIKSEYLKLKGTLFRFYILNLRPLAKIFFLQDDFS